MKRGSPIRSNRVPVTVRLAVPAGLSAAEAFKLRERWDRALDIELDRDYGPVPIRPSRRARKGGREPEGQLVLVRAWVHPEHIARLKTQPHVHHVEHDARIEPFTGQTAEKRGAVSAAPGTVDCGTGQAVGTAADVARTLGATRIWTTGCTGRGIVVGVVDGGITSHRRPTRFNEWPAIPQPPAAGDVVGGWPSDWGTTAQGWGQHGNMIAFDIQAMAPEAELWDIRIWQPDVSFPSYVSNAVTGYHLAIQHYKAHGFPHILVNSWGVYDSDNGPDYAFNPESNIALKVEEAVDAGLLVLFAAGNCGDGCPFPAGTPCGNGNRGPGGSILGPNGHPDVMTVGAATIHGAWCGYTSQGPAALPPNDPHKPDFCAVSEFEGYFPNESGLRPCDGGTSAATGVVGGVVALLKQAWPGLTQEDCKQLLKATARPISTPAASGGAGAGVIDALRAFRLL